MAKYDLETFLKGVEAFLIANLNTAIDAMNTEKNDGTTLKHVDSDAYHIQYLGDQTELSDPFVLIEEADEPSVQGDVGGHVAITYHVGVWILVSDPGTDPNVPSILFRYRRVLMDLFIANWDSISNAEKTSIHASMPSPPFQNQEQSWEGRAIGVVLSVTIAD